MLPEAKLIYICTSWTRAQIKGLVETQKYGCISNLLKTRLKQKKQFFTEMPEWAEDKMERETS